MALAAAAIGGLASGGANLISSLGTAGIQYAAGKSLQSSEQTYNQNVMSRAESAYTSVGLPKFLAYSGNSGAAHLPGQQFQVRGGNFYSSGLVGQSLPVFSTPMQQYTHQGRPGATIGPPEEERDQSFGNNFNMQPRNFWSGTSGKNQFNFYSQNDRAGLGSGRYGITMQNSPTTSSNVPAHRSAAGLLNTPPTHYPNGSAFYAHG